MASNVEFYAFTDKQTCLEHLAIYNTRQLAVSRAAGDTITETWDAARQGTDGRWYFQKPDNLPCGDIFALGGCVVVANPEFPEPDAE